MKKTHIVVLAALVAVLCSMVPQATATGACKLEILVRSAAGCPIKGALVTIRNQQTDDTFENVTNEKGEAKFAQLDCGLY